MNEWQIAAAVLIALLVPCAALCVRRSFAEGLVALQLAGTLAALALMVLAEGESREPFADLALVLAALSFAGILLFARFLEENR